MLSYDDIVFDTYTADSRNVHTGLNRYHLTGFQEIPAAWREPGMFVHIETETVTQGMRKTFVKPFFPEHPSGLRIHSAGGRPVPDEGHGRELCREDRLIHPSQPDRYSPHGDCSSEVTAISVHATPEIQGHQFTGSNAFVRGSCVRECPPNTARHDGFEGVSVRTIESLKIRKLRRDFGFTYTGFDHRQDVSKHHVAQFRRRTDETDFPFILDGHKIVQHSVRVLPRQSRTTLFHSTQEGRGSTLSVEPDARPASQPKPGKKCVR